MPDDGFGIENLPYGIVGGRPAVRLDNHAIDLGALGLTSVLPAVLGEPDLNAFIALGRPAWDAVRQELQQAIEEGRHERALTPLANLEPTLPIAVGDYVDFYASIEHASNLGRMFRPDSDPLLPNWRHLPVGYHGRAGTVVVSGTPIRRPQGQLPPARPGDAPTFGPEPRLDIELELGFVTGPGPELARPSPHPAPPPEWVGGSEGAAQARSRRPVRRRLVANG